MLIKTHHSFLVTPSVFLLLLTSLLCLLLFFLSLLIQFFVARAFISHFFLHFLLEFLVFFIFRGPFNPLFLQLLLYFSTLHLLELSFVLLVPSYVSFLGFFKVSRLGSFPMLVRFLHQESEISGRDSGGTGDFPLSVYRLTVSVLLNSLGISYPLGFQLFQFFG